MGRQRDFHMFIRLLLNLRKQKDWKNMVICLHLSISNKNLPQPPACLQDFLSCLATIIFKPAEFLLEELPLLVSPLQFHPTLNYFSSYDAVLLHHRIHVTRLQSTLQFAACYFSSPSPYLRSHFKDDLHI